MEKIKVSGIEEFANKGSEIQLLGYNPTVKKLGYVPLSSISSSKSFCGVRWKKAEAKTEGEPFGDINMLANLPTILGLGGYLVKNDHTRRKLDPNNHKRFADGGVAALDGTMGHYHWGWNIPWYYAHWEDDIYVYEAVSVSKIRGRWNYKIPVASMSCSGAAALDRTNKILVSYCNRTAQYRGGNNVADNDTKWNTLLGKAVNSIDSTQFQRYAEKNGERWGASMYQMVFALGVLTRIIFHNRNIQASYNSTRTADNLYQGGLGMGIDNAYSDFGEQCATLDIDALAEKGDATGVFSVTIAKGDGTNKVIGNIPCFFGLKNWYKNMWMMMHGVIIQYTASKEVDVYILRKWTKDAVNVSDTNGFIKVGTIPSVDKDGWYYTKRMNLDNMIMYPLEFGASESTGYADGFYHPAATSGLRGLAAFAFVYVGGDAGSGALHANSGVTVSYASCGAFLCEADEDWDTQATWIA